MKFLFLLILEASIRYCSGSLSCELKIPSLSLSVTDMQKVISIMAAQEFGPKILDDIAITELVLIEQELNYKRVRDNEDIHLNITELLKKYGHNTEEYQVQTTDGYILTLFRVRGKGPSIFVMHGLTGSAVDYVTAGPDSALVYSLAAAGCDVWLGNARGNKYSRKHVSISPECSEFWDFSWDEIGRYDLPAMIDFALKTAGQTKLAYVGHSQGTTTFFVMASERPEYNEKISLMVAMSPIVYLSHVLSPIIRVLAQNDYIADLILQAIGQQEFAPDNKFSSALSVAFCGANALAEIVCSHPELIVTGFDHGQMNVTNLPVNIGHTPAGSSTKTLIHYAQLVKSARFCRYDYGEKKNKEKYGSSTPPDYPIEKVTAPVALFFSDNDWVSSLTDVKILRDKLQNVVDFYLLHNYCHIDYIWATNIKELVNDKIVDLLNKYVLE